MTNKSGPGNVLVVDDQPVRADALLSALAPSPFHFTTVHEVPDLEAVLGPESPWDCVVCNVDLNRVSWASVRRAMRNFDVQVPVIVVADDRGVDTMTTALGLGATDFFVKPQERPGLLKRSIERGVNHRQLQRELQDSKDNLERSNADLRHSLRVLEQDQQAGRQVQMALLPAGPLQQAGYWFSHTILPSLYLSGDFTDYFSVGDHDIVFFLADVSGHGSSSAFATVLLKNLFARKRSDFLRRDDHAIRSPGKMLALANSELLELEINKYATMVVGVLNCAQNTLCYSVAGHLPHPVLVSVDGVSYLEGEGSPVGLMEHAAFTEQTVTLPAQFVLALLSDGVLELLGDGNLIEKEAALLQRLEGPLDGPRGLTERLGLQSIDPDDLPDDVAALFVSRGFL
jgi:serine phosphatase RsbU (regulator of sigma subunit)